jgi:hypothetical protein
MISPGWNLFGFGCLCLSTCYAYHSSDTIKLWKTTNFRSDWSRLYNVVPTRRGFVTKSISSCWIGTSILLTNSRPAQSIGPVKVDLQNPTYIAVPCPPSKPIPGEKAMKGLRGLCVTVQAELTEPPPKELEKVGVYGFVKDGDSGDSVLANNPDLSTDAGQFSMIERVTPSDTKVTFEFIAAIPMERDLSLYENGIGPLDFSSLRIISYPGGEQYGAINPCEMNEFSEECDAWVEENGPYEKGKFMMESNKRTKGR